MSAVTQGSQEGTMGQKTDGGSPREQVRALPLQIKGLCVRLLPCFPGKYLCRPCPLPSPPGIPGPLDLWGASLQVKVGRGGGLCWHSLPGGQDQGLRSRPTEVLGSLVAPRSSPPYHTPRLALNPHRFGAGRCPRVTWGGGRQDPFLVAWGGHVCGAVCHGRRGPWTWSWPHDTSRRAWLCLPAPALAGSLPRRLSISGCVE